MTTETQKPPYRVPQVYPECEPVSLDQFSTQEIREYLRHRHQDEGGDPSLRTNDAMVIEADEISRIETLALCGQAEHARAELLRIVSDHIGREL